MKGSYCVGEIGKKQVTDSVQLIEAAIEGDSETLKRKADTSDDAQSNKRQDTEKAKTYLKTGVKHHAMYDVGADEEMEKYRKERGEYEDPLRNMGDELLPL